MLSADEIKNRQKHMERVMEAKSDEKFRGPYPVGDFKFPEENFVDFHVQ